MAGPLLIVLATVAIMEGVAYCVHRWVMHGPLGWGWHKSHHDDDHEGTFEKNDLYAVAFAGLAVALFAFGSRWWTPLWWVAVGMSVYGVIYFVVHDGMVHQRWPGALRSPEPAAPARLHSHLGGGADRACDCRGPRRPLGADPARPLCRERIPHLRSGPTRRRPALGGRVVHEQGLHAFRDLRHEGEWTPLRWLWINRRDAAGRHSYPLHLQAGFLRICFET